MHAEVEVSHQQDDEVELGAEKNRRREKEP